MKESLDNIEGAVDEVLNPNRIMRWIVRIVLLIILISVGVVVTKLALHMTAKVETVTTDREWYLSQQEAIEAASIQVEAAKEALVRHQQEVEGRSGTFSMSHQSDRDESANLNHEILTAENKRVALIREFNSALRRATDPAIKKEFQTVQLKATGNE